MRYAKKAGKAMFLIVCCTLAWSLAGLAQSGPEVSYAIAHAVSPPVRDMISTPFGLGASHVVPLGRPNTIPAGLIGPDPLLQSSEGPSASSIGTSSLLDFEGTDIDTSICNCAPPDTNMAVGNTTSGQLVQWGQCPVLGVQ